jgi:hypothetical protein
LLMLLLLLLLPSSLSLGPVILYFCLWSQFYWLYLAISFLNAWNLSLVSVGCLNVSLFSSVTVQFLLVIAPLLCYYTVWEFSIYATHADCLALLWRGCLTLLLLSGEFHINIRFVLSVWRPNLTSEGAPYTDKIVNVKQ